jgi:hypothetical protein
MSDFIDHLLARTIDSSAILLPRPSSLFEPVSPFRSQPVTGEIETAHAEFTDEVTQPLTRPQAIESSPPPPPEQPVVVRVPDSPDIPTVHPSSPASQAMISSESQAQAAKTNRSTVGRVLARQETTATAPPPLTHYDTAAASETPSAESKPRSTESATAPLTTPATSLKPAPPAAVDEVEPAPSPREESAQVPDESEQQPADQPPINILTAMVRQMVLQPSFGEKPLRPEIKPAKVIADIESPPIETPTTPRDQQPSETMSEWIPESARDHSRTVSAQTPRHPVPLKIPSLRNSPPIDLSATTEPHVTRPNTRSTSPPLKPLTQRMPPLTEPAQTTEVHISIGRVEVRAVSEQPASPPTSKPQSEPEIMSLDAYLAQRSQGKGQV